ncbi:MAG: glycosyl transferase, partial [Alicyclobacillus sp.]|nr:glycosyl transferase [Alicyclobacillus sp.]
MLPVKFDHLRRMTDDTGLLEHCLGKIPRRAEGYATDDNARGLWLCMAWLPYARRWGAAEDVRLLSSLADTYLAYLLWVQHENGWFHNDVRFDRSFEPETPSEDCQGRTLWALATLMVADVDWHRWMVGYSACRRGFEAAGSLKSLRGRAHALAAACLLLRAASAAPGPLRSQSGYAGLDVFSVAQDLKMWLQTDVRPLAATYTEALRRSYRDHRTARWHWFEPTLTYANGVLPWALF